MANEDNRFRARDEVQRLREDIRALTKIVDDAHARGSDNAVTDAVKHVLEDRQRQLQKIEHPL